VYMSTERVVVIRGRLAILDLCLAGMPSADSDKCVAYCHQLANLVIKVATRCITTAWSRFLCLRVVVRRPGPTRLRNLRGLAVRLLVVGDRGYTGVVLVPFLRRPCREVAAK
jgi:hypothetical protein